ncbi:MAG: M42 family metallopeptidase [Lachnospiraceae bacterium]|nr:M42 family metallopeptidase [Lachnospiraceae bacterium]
MLDTKYMSDFLEEILAIGSTAGDTYDAMERCREEFEKYDMETEYTKKGAIIGYLKGEDDSKQRLISAHVDTIGAMVKEIKDNGRLKISLIGGYSFNTIEGENLIVKTCEGKTYTGTYLPVKASIHVFSDVVKEELRTEESMEIRLDEDVKTAEDTLALGIRVGDFVFFDTRTVVLPNGYIKSRYLDDKACIAMVFGAIKYMKENGLKPAHTIQFYISNYEEIGHGVSQFAPEVEEHLALDIGTVGPGHTSDEKKVTVLAKDSRTPYDFRFRNRLATLAKKAGIGYVVDVHFRYGSDASISALAGQEPNFACIGPGVEATHHYERTHIDGIENGAKLIVEYIREK